MKDGDRVRWNRFRVRRRAFTRRINWTDVRAWGLEILGVAIIGIAASMIYAPAGLIIAGVYVIIAANHDGSS